MNTSPTTFALGDPAPKKLLESLLPDVVVQVPLKYMSVETGFNARDFTSAENVDHVARLAKLIGANGIEVPVQVRLDAGRIVLVDGESRVRAALLAVEAGSKKAETIPSLLDPESADEVRRTESLVVKNSGRPLAMLETLGVVKRLRTLGKTNEDIQGALGFSRFHMTNLRLLDQATEPVREHIRSGRISPSLVVELVREYKEPEAVEAGVAAAVRKEEQKAARGSTAPGAVGKVTKTKLAKSRGEVIYTRAVFNGFIHLCQTLLRDMTPAAEYRKFRNKIMQALDNAGAPRELTEPNEE